MHRSLLAVVLTASAVAALSPGLASAGSRGITIAARGSAYGTVLFDGRGRALYAFTKDSRNRSRCAGACAAAWPVAYTSGRPRAGGGVRSRLLGSIARRGGGRQVTYAGRPLYYYVGDGVGQIRCQNVFEYGGTWLVVRGSGALVR
jgi:predicted lipoprotein with Yx(FWY)xxD motif